MSTNNLDAAAIGKHVQQPVKHKPRGWFRRNWKWFVPALLLAIVVVGGGALYWAFFLRVYNLEVFQAAMRTIEADKGVQETLGRPIYPVKRPASPFSWAGWQEIVPNHRIEESEIDVIWSIEGPKAQAKAHLNARLRQGKWDTVTLEVEPAGSKKVSLHAAGNPEDEAPVFQGANPEPPKAGEKKPDVKKPETKGSDLNIDFHIPPGDVPAGGK